MNQTLTSTMENRDARASWELLRTRTDGRVAATRLGRPEICPVNHRVMQGRMRFGTDPGAKPRAVLLDAREGFEIDGVEASTAWSVLVNGSAEEVQHSPDPTFPPSVPGAPWVPGPRSAVVDITPAEVTGRRFRRAG